MSTTYTQPKRTGDVVVREVDPTWSRDQAVLAPNKVAVIGLVLARILVGAAASAAKTGGNTGNGVLTLDATTPVLAGAKVGVYTARCVTAAANGGTFRIEDPDGYVLGDVAVGGTFSDDIKFVIADGAADFIVGDGFDITVAAGLERVTPLDFTARDGSQIADCVAIEALASSTDPQDIVVEARGAVLDAENLTWPAGATDGQKAAALTLLRAKGLVSRSAA